MLIGRHFLAMAAAVALLTCGAMTARAQPGGGLYVAGGGGADFMRATNGTTNNGQGGKFSFERGWAAAAAIGYGFANGLRIEGELAYRRNSFDKVDEEPGGGSVYSQSVMVNLLYDIGTGTAFTPYAGAGAGYARVNASDFTVPDNVAFSGSEDVFVHQFLAGVAVAVADRLKLDLGYRYVLMEDPVFGLRSQGGGAGTSASFPHRHQVVLLQLRYEFGRR